jgi:hypothetical protein
LQPERIGRIALRAEVERTDARKMGRAKRRSSGRLPETPRPGPPQPERGPDSTLAAGRLRAVVEHIEDPEGHLVEVYWPTGVAGRPPYADPIDLTRSEEALQRDVAELAARAGPEG